jgi:hypothetical protein
MARPVGASILPCSNSLKANDSHPPFVAGLVEDHDELTLESSGEASGSGASQQQVLEPYLNAFAAFRDEIRTAAREGAPRVSRLGLCTPGSRLRCTRRTDLHISYLAVKPMNWITRAHSFWSACPHEWTAF